MNKRKEIMFFECVTRKNGEKRVYNDIVWPQQNTAKR